MIPFDHAYALILDEEPHAKVGDTGECLQGCQRCEAESRVWEAIALAISAESIARALAK